MSTRGRAADRLSLRAAARRDRRRAAIGAVAAGALLLGACTAGDTQLVVTADGLDHEVGPWRLQVPAGSAEGDEYEITADQSSTEEYDEAGVILDDRLTIETAAQPAAGVTLSMTLDEPLESEQVAMLVTRDDSADEWLPVPTAVSDDQQTLTAYPEQFSEYGVSFWEDFGYSTTEALSASAEPPQCEGDTPAWAAETDFASDEGSPVLYCTGSDAEDSDVLVAKVANNRGYGMWVSLPAGAEWSYATAFDLMDPVQWFEQLAELMNPETAENLAGRVLLPPGGELHVGLGRERVAGAEDGLVVDVQLDETSIAMGAIAEMVLSRTGEGFDHFATILAYQSFATCAADLWQSDDVESDLRAMLSCVISDRGDIYESAVTAAEAQGFDTTAIADIEDAAQLGLKLLGYAQILELLAAADEEGELGSVAGGLRVQLDPADPLLALREGQGSLQPAELANLTDLTERVSEFSGEESIPAMIGPLGNIRCSFSLASLEVQVTPPQFAVSCDALEADWGSLRDPECELDWLPTDVILSRQVSGPGSCRSDALHPNLANPEPFDSGTGYLVGPLVCLSGDSGVECENLLTGAAMALSMSSLDIVEPTTDPDSLNERLVALAGAYCDDRDRQQLYLQEALAIGGDVADLAPAISELASTCGVAPDELYPATAAEDDRRTLDSLLES